MRLKGGAMLTQNEFEQQRKISEFLNKQSEELRLLCDDGRRYRKLRDMGDHQTFGEYVVVRVEDCKIGTQTWSGKRLDAMLDAMDIENHKGISNAG
jgi:hypothetical protein